LEDCKTDYISYNQNVGTKKKYIFMFGLLHLTPLSTIFQLYRGSQFIGGGNLMKLIDISL
jgi:hypothetical protein